MMIEEFLSGSGRPLHMEEGRGGAFLPRLLYWAGVALAHVVLLATAAHYAPPPSVPVRVVQVSLITSAPSQAVPAASLQPLSPEPAPKRAPKPKPAPRLEKRVEPVSRNAPAKRSAEPGRQRTPSPLAIAGLPAEAALPTSAAGGHVAAQAMAESPALSAPSAAASSLGAPAPLTPPMFHADYLDNPAPLYPLMSRRRGETGRVVLRVFVSAEGHAQRVEVRSSSGSDLLDSAAREAVGRWRFVPARRGDEKVAAWVLVPISFVM